MHNLLLNTLKSFTVLFGASILFVFAITLFPLIGALTINNLPIQDIIKDNFALLLPLFIVCILTSPLFGLATFRLKKKRLLYLFIIGIGSCWIAIIAVMLMWSNFTIADKDVSLMMMLSVWTLVAYSFFSLPILIPSIFIIEKWTR